MITQDQNNRPLFEGLTEEQAQQIAEAAAKAGMTYDEAVAFVNEKMPGIIEAITAWIPVFVNTLAEAAKGIATLANKYGIGLEKRMKRVATPKEWHLMNHAKKARTRKKYRNRLIRRLREQEGGRRGVHTT